MFDAAIISAETKSVAMRLFDKMIFAEARLFKAIFFYSFLSSHKIWFDIFEFDDSNVFEFNNSNVFETDLIN